MRVSDDLIPIEDFSLVSEDSIPILSLSLFSVPQKKGTDTG